MSENICKKPLPECMKILGTEDIDPHCTCMKISIHGTIYNAYLGTGGGYVKIEGNDNLMIPCANFDIEENEYADNRKEVVCRTRGGEVSARIVLDNKSEVSK